jgi:hypothetical protein
VAVIESGVGHEQPLHPSVQVAVGLGTHQQVKMVRHQTVPEHIHGKPSTGVDDGLDKGVLVARLMEDGLAAVAAVEHVIPHAANRGSGSSWHDTIVKHHPRTLNINYVPFCRTRWVSRPPIAARNSWGVVKRRMTKMPLLAWA